MVDAPTLPRSRSELDEFLVAAIEGGRLREVLAALTQATLGHEVRERVTEAATAVAAIDTSVATETERLIERLESVGVRASADAQVTVERPLHLIRLGVDRERADAAQHALSELGYAWVGPVHPAAWRAHRAFHANAWFRGSGSPAFRLELTWAGGRLADGRASRLLAPTASDLAAAEFPRAAWPLYVPLRLARLLVRRARPGGPVDLGPFLETPEALIGPLLDIAELSSDDLVVDIGCGDGRIVIAAATRAGCRARGIELSEELAELARGNVAAAGLADRVEIVHGDATAMALTDATAVVVFLPVAAMQSLVPRVLAELGPGGRVVAHEQEALALAPDLHVPLFSADGITVARRWNR